MIETLRLRLHMWEDRHRDPFATMHTDPEVMADLGGPISRSESDEKFARYSTAQRDQGISRWAVETPDGRFLGYAGVSPRFHEDHPLGVHYELGWRLVRDAWGKGYATESARAALRHAVHEVGLGEIFSYTSLENIRSQAVMARLNLIRDSARDFILRNESSEQWQGLVWAVPEPTLGSKALVTERERRLRRSAQRRFA